MIGDSSRGNYSADISSLSVEELTTWIPGLAQVLKDMGIPVGKKGATFKFLCEEAGVEPSVVFASAAARAEPAVVERAGVGTLTVKGGTDKDGIPEPVESVDIRSGEVIALVGATGSGKSRFLSDIDSLSSGDSASKRRVYLDGSTYETAGSRGFAFRPVAHISQSMYFFLDLAVAEFLERHATCRSINNPSVIIPRVIDAACTLCGEPFQADVPIVSLSGGQSRALMIADVVLIGSSPIVLIDEIENAGIDREKALSFLIEEGKITVLATHDPLLALSAHRRIHFKNGAMTRVIERSNADIVIAGKIEEEEKQIRSLREKIRNGEILDG